MKEIIMTSVLQGFDQKKNFLEGWFWFKINNLELVLGSALKFRNSEVKGFKPKVRKFWKLIPTFIEVTGEKLVDKKDPYPE